MVPGTLIAFSPTKVQQSLFIFALHRMPARTSDEKGGRLSVRPSVKRVHCDIT